MSDTWDEPLVRRLAGTRDRSATQAQIERIADRWRADTGQTAFPVAVFALASAHGIRVRRSRAHPFAGRIYADGDRIVIDVNAADSEERQRFTCAHELMHTAFPGFSRERRYRVDRDLEDGLFARGRAEEELLCDLGAAALLMPRDLLGPFLDGGPLEAVETLARSAVVSLEAAANRLVRLRPGPGVFLVLERLHAPADRRRARRGEPSSPELRVRYAVASGSRAWVPRFAAAGEDSVFARAAASRRVERREEALPGASGGSWTIEAKAYPRRGSMRILAMAERAAAVPAAPIDTVGTR